MAEILKNPLCRGVTFSGGEPFAQPEGFACLAKLLKETCGVQNVIISYIGAVIGSHAGPGTIAMFYLGSKR